MESVIAQQDAEIRRQERIRRELHESLAERGAVFERSLHATDSRSLPPLSELPKMHHSEAFLAYRESRKGERARGSYLTGLPAKKQQPKKKEKPPPADDSADKVHARAQALLDEMQRDSVDVATQMAARLDAKEVFSPEANRVRAFSVARMEWRRRVTLDGVKRVASDQVATGFVPRSEAADAVASGAGAADLRASELLLGRLELLDERLGVELLASASRGGLMRGGSKLRGDDGRRGSLLGSRGSSRDVRFGTMPPSSSEPGGVLGNVRGAGMRASASTPALPVGAKPSGAGLRSYQSTCCAVRS
jgi:hypothetical protein